MFIKLRDNFWLKTDDIQAIEYVESQTLSHYFLKIWCNNYEGTLYSFQGEDAKNGFERLQVLLKPEGLKNPPNLHEIAKQEEWIKNYKEWEEGTPPKKYPDDWPDDVE